MCTNTVQRPTVVLGHPLLAPILSYVFFGDLIFCSSLFWRPWHVFSTPINFVSRSSLRLNFVAPKNGTPSSSGSAGSIVTPLILLNNSGRLILTNLRKRLRDWDHVTSDTSFLAQLWIEWGRVVSSLAWYYLDFNIPVMRRFNFTRS